MKRCYNGHDQVEDSYRLSLTQPLRLDDILLKVEVLV